MEVQNLKPNPKNPRKTTDEKLKSLDRTMTEFGDLGCIVFNRKTKHLVTGHQRTKTFLPNSKITIVKRLEKPSKTGTVAMGYVEAKGEKFPYREVEWDEEKEKAATIAANKNVGEWDLPRLGEWLQELDDFGFDLDLTLFGENERSIFLQGVEEVNKGSENSEWAQMGEEHEFKKGEKYISLAIHFKTEKAREQFIAEHDIHVEKKLSAGGTWIARA